MATERTLIDLSVAEDADLSNPGRLRRQWDTTAANAYPIGAQTLAALDVVTLNPPTGAFLSQIALAVRGRVRVRLTYNTLSPPGPTADLPIDAPGTGATTERIVVLGPFPTAVANGWAATDRVAGMQITAIGGGGGATVLGYTLGT